VIDTPKLVFQPILPELILAGFAMVGLLYEALIRRPDRTVHLLIALAGIACAVAASIVLWRWTGDASVMGAGVRQGMIDADRYAVMGRVILLAIATMALLYGTHYLGRGAGQEARGEFYPLVLFATMGMTLIVAAADLIVVFLALEILSLSLYVLTGITGERRSNEAAMKYFLLGAASSAFFLYGVAMAYGATNTTHIAAMARALSGTTGNQAIALLAMAFLAVGFAFKVSAVPFHMWTPDVYQGAPTPVTGFMSAATKVAAFLAFIRVLDVAFQPLTWDWVPVIWVLAALSVVVGSVLAIAQTDIKRMLAYSSIAQAGFILTGLTAGTSVGIRAAMFYLIAYAAMTLGAFGIVMLVSSRGEEQTSLSSYRGLYKRSPVLAALMTIFLLSLAGIPPTAGFIAKVGVFTAAVSAGHWSLALIGVLASVAAAFFYLRVIVLMYMQAPQGEQDEDHSVLPRLAVAIPAVLTLVLGVFPGLVTGLIEKASVLRW
jgi:NADH-quinone oxidoreductase subunit N